MRGQGHLTAAAAAGRSRGVGAHAVEERKALQVAAHAEAGLHGGVVAHLGGPGQAAGRQGRGDGRCGERGDKAYCKIKKCYPGGRGGALTRPRTGRFRRK